MSPLRRPPAEVVLEAAPRSSRAPPRAARCIVQPFTTTKNRLHCIIDSEGLPPPTTIYDPSGSFASHPLRVVRNGRIAQCWHVGGANHGCFIRFDLGGTPRIERLLTPTVQSGGVVRVRGAGIDGGVLGSERMVGTLFRGGGRVVVGACGEKDCAPSNLGVETIGCLSRVGGGGDAVRDENGQVATAFSDASHFGCQLDALAGTREGRGAEGSPPRARAPRGGVILPQHSLHHHPHPPLAPSLRPFTPPRPHPAMVAARRRPHGGLLQRLPACHRQRAPRRCLVTGRRSNPAPSSLPMPAAGCREVLDLRVATHLAPVPCSTGFVTSQRVDLTDGTPFDVEVLPRIRRISPSKGSMAGGADLTICAPRLVDRGDHHTPAH